MSAGLTDIPFFTPFFLAGKTAFCLYTFNVNKITDFASEYLKIFVISYIYYEFCANEKEKMRSTAAFGECNFPFKKSEKFFVHVQSPYVENNAF